MVAVEFSMNKVDYKFISCILVCSKGINSFNEWGIAAVVDQCALKKWGYSTISPCTDIPGSLDVPVSLDMQEIDSKAPPNSQIIVIKWVQLSTSMHCMM